MASKLLCLGVWFVIIALDPAKIGIRGSADVGLYFTEEPPHQAVGVKSRPFTLNCSAAGADNAGPITFSWIKDGVPVEDDERRYILRNSGSLYFQRVIDKKDRGRTDEGSYQCAANNQLGTILSRVSQFYVAGLEKFSGSGQPQNTTVAEGESARLACTTEGKPQPTFTWEKDRRSLPLNNTRYTALTSGVLQITNVVQSDAGEYRCTASNLLRSRHSSHANLTIKKAGQARSPRFLEGPHTHSTSAGDTAILECLATGTPLPQLVWTSQDGTPIELDSRRTLLGSSNLQIASVTSDDQGDYYCQMVDDSNQYIRVSLIVNEPPKPVLSGMSPRNITMKQPGDSVMTCDFQHFDNITWLHNGEKIIDPWRNIHRLDRNRTLKIRWCLPQHTGLYQCVAQNQAGSASYTIRFTADLPVQPPVLNVQAEAQSATSIRLSWYPPNLEVDKNTEAGIFAYSVHYAPENGMEYQKVVNLTYALLDQLKPYCNYSLHVVPYSKKMYGAPSKIIYQRTLESVPSEAPEVKVTPDQASSLLVEWTPLPVGEANGVVVQYKLVWRRKGDGSEQQEILPADTTQYVLADLEANQLYEVRVLAATKIGFPRLPEEDWPWVEGLTLNFINTGVPLKPQLRLENLSPNGLRATWSMPRDSPSPTWYVLHYRQVKRTDGYDGTARLSHAETVTYRMLLLDPNTLYEVNLTAFNLNGNGPSAVQQARTNPEVDGDFDALPPVPADVHVKALNSTSVFISWKLPATQIVTHCSIRYTVLPPGGKNARSPANYTSVLAINTNNTRVLTDLRPFTMYTFSVRSHTIHQQPSDFSESVTVRMPQGRPSEPKLPQLALFGANAVEMTWEAPEHENGVIIYYMVNFRKDDLQADPEAWPWEEKRENSTCRRSVVQELQVNTMYLFKLQAATEAGMGESTKELRVQTKSGSSAARRDEKELGIIVGVAIGGGCIIICALVLFIRSRCCTRQHPPVHYQPPANQFLVKCNGRSVVPNGHGPACRYAEYLDDREEVCQPMMTRIPDANHLDAKGKGGQNGKVRHVGPLSNGLQVCYTSNGKVSTFLHPGHPALKHIKGVEDPATQVALCPAVEDASPETQHSSVDPTQCYLDDIDRSVHSGEEEEVETSFAQESDPASRAGGVCQPCEGQRDTAMSSTPWQQRPYPSRHSVPTSHDGSGGCPNGPTPNGRPISVPSDNRHIRAHTGGSEPLDSGAPWQQRSSTPPPQLSPLAQTVTHHQQQQQQQHQEQADLQHTGSSYVTSVI